MKLKIKIKNLIIISLLTIFIVLIAVPFTTLQIGNFLNGMDSDKATVFYESYLGKAIKPNEVQALYKYAEHLRGNKYKYSIMLNGWSFPQSKATLLDMKKAKNALIRILENEKASRKYTQLAYMELLEVLVSTGENHELIKYIEWGSKNKDEEIQYNSSIYNALLKGDYELADKILKNYNGILDKDYYKIKGYIAVLNNNELEKEDYDQGSIFDFYEKEYKELFKGTYKIKGRVSYNGVGIPFVEIYIQEDTGGYRTSSDGFLAITDINGEYETLGLRSGRYDIGIGINHVVLYDKVHLKKSISFLELEEDMEFNYEFADPIKVLDPIPGTIIDSNTFEVKWESVEGADYYSIETVSYSNPMDKNSGWITYPIKYKLNAKDTKYETAVFEVDKLRSEAKVYRYDDDWLPTPETIIGGFFPGFDYTIIVNAFDSGGNMVGSSQGQRVYYDEMNSIKIKGKLSQGEHIILKKEYEKAIDYYERALNNNPEDLEALKYLAKFYSLGWKKGTMDYTKAIKYGEKYYSINKDSALLLQTIGEMNKEDRKSNKKLVKEILDLVAEGDKDYYYYNELGDYYESIGEYSAAILAYEKMEFNVPINVLFIEMYLGDLNSALEILKTPAFKPYRMSKKKLIRSIERLSSEDLVSEDYKYFQEILEKQLSGNLLGEERKQLFYKLRKMINNPDIRYILDEFKVLLL